MEYDISFLGTKVLHQHLSSKIMERQMYGANFCLGIVTCRNKPTRLLCTQNSHPLVISRGDFCHLSDLPMTFIILKDFRRALASFQIEKNAPTSDYLIMNQILLLISDLKNTLLKSLKHLNYRINKYIIFYVYFLFSIPNVNNSVALF